MALTDHELATIMATLAITAVGVTVMLLLIFGVF